MKRHYAYWLLSWFFLFSCQPEDLEEMSVTLPVDELPITNSVIENGGKTSYVGYGFNPNRGESGKPYKLALMDNNVIRSSQVNKALDTDLEIIDSYEKLEQFTERVKKRSGGFNFYILRLGGSRGKRLIEATRVDEEYFTVMARISVETVRYDIDDAPSLTPEAQALIDNGEVQKFFGEYGPMYVSYQILGGEVYYVYHVSRSRLTEITGKSSSGSIEFGVQWGTFGFNAGGGGSSSDSEYLDISRAVTSAGIVSNIPGYNANIVDSQEDYEEELRKIPAYLNQYPERAATMEMDLVYYSSFILDDAFRAEEVRQLACTEAYADWKSVGNELEYIYNNTAIPPLKNKVEQASYQVSRGISDATLCANTNDPSDLFQDLTAWRALEERSASLYRYYSEERQNHYYTTDPESIKNVHGGDSYQLERVQCRVLVAPEEGTTWLKEYWYNQGDDHRYNSELLDQGEGEAYRFVRDIGHIFKNNNEDEAIDRDWLRPLYLYYNQERQDHLITTDPDGETFGTVKGGDGYRFLGTLGYAIGRGY